MHFLVASLSEIPARLRVVLEIVHGVIERNFRSLHKGIDFGARFEPEHTPDLGATQNARAVSIDCERLESVPGQITPLLGEVVLNILGQFDFYCHAGSPGLAPCWSSTSLA
jgi:hypothetical protein